MSRVNMPLRDDIIDIFMMARKNRESFKKLVDLHHNLDPEADEEFDREVRAASDKVMLALMSYQFLILQTYIRSNLN